MRKQQEMEAELIRIKKEMAVVKGQAKKGTYVASDDEGEIEGLMMNSPRPRFVGDN